MPLVDFRTAISFQNAWGAYLSRGDAAEHFVSGEADFHPNTDPARSNDFLMSAT